MEPTEKPKFNWTRLIITIVLVVLTAGALGGGVWYYMNQQSLKAEDAKNKEVEQLQKQIDELKKPATSSTTTTATADAVASWKTYNNATNKLSFKYPTDWTVSETQGECGGVKVTKPSGDVFEAVVGTTTCGRGAEGVRRFIHYPGSLSGIKIVLGAREFSESTELPTESGGIPTSGYIVVLNDAVQYSGKHYIFSMSGRNHLDSESGEDTFKKIINTLNYQ